MWLGEDETAREMLDRVQPERPFLLPPPLHRVPLRVGNVLEIVGPSTSAKTNILIQAAISCILPVEYGGLGYIVVFFDLDCRFDILRFSDLLKHRIIISAIQEEKNNEEVFALCMKRFRYTTCHDSFEFLASLKTLNYRLPKERDVHILMIDSIGAFHWMDRVLSTFPLEGNNRKILSLQRMLETVVQEIRKLLQVHPMLVIATKATILTNAASSNQLFPYREYMPSIWQSFITHRMLVRRTDDNQYQSEWIKPPLNFLDTFLVEDVR